MRSPVAPLLLAALLPFASGCTTGSRERACDPVQQTGCASGRCVVDAAGAPACLEPVADAPEGSLCDAPDVCAAGLGCARVAGVARCLRFCATAGGSDECVAARADDPVPAEVRAEALCAVAIPDRSDLGLCVLPCRPGVGDCPDGTRCGVAEGIGLLTCVPAGTLGVGAPCGGTLDSCAGGLACAPMGPGRTCAPLVAGADDCPLDTEPTALPVRSGAAVCVPCQGLGPRPGGGVWGACLGSRPLEGEGACDAADATCG
ncbi:MAG: hypothetical protein KC613_28440, partial [Myxococcales bacterium]|nr:hypothetical protein [Myxococcales bacterium]